MAENPAIVTGMLKAIFTGGDRVRASDDALRQAAAVSAAVYGEKDAEYWYEYFHVKTEKDKQGLTVELGGSSVSNLADNLHLFGLAPGAPNAFGATYKVFGEIVKSQYPELLPAYDPVSQVLDTRYLATLAKRGATGTPEALSFEGARLGDVVSRRSWEIAFDTGRATFTPGARQELDRLFDDLVVASGTLVEVHGHTDAQGTPEANQVLSESRAFAVTSYLEARGRAVFPGGRIRVFAHGATQPVASNLSAHGRAKNRRVEIVLGTAS
jgi:outer membrane protein OmpA-like peptidoglycan-associated protein